MGGLPKDFFEKLAKAFSAFANSGGGHIILGIKDDKTIDGLPKIHKGRTTTREWLEQVIPNLVQPIPTKFRVHEVTIQENQEKDNNIIIVIDIDDSFLAPFQSNYKKIYYHRVAGHSVAASHFYLENLRNRTNNSLLIATVNNAKVIRIIDTEKGLFYQILLTFRIENKGNTTPKFWKINLLNNDNKIDSEGKILRKNFPSPSIYFPDETYSKAILPTDTGIAKTLIGIYITNKNNIIDINGFNYAVDKYFEDINLSTTVITNTNVCDQTKIENKIIKDSLKNANFIECTSPINKSFTGEIGNGIKIINFIFNDSIGDSYINFSCIAENVSNIKYKELAVQIVFRDSNESIIHIEDLNIGLLPPHSKRLFKDQIEINKISSAQKKEFYSYDKADFFNFYKN